MGRRHQPRTLGEIRPERLRLRGKRCKRGAKIGRHLWFRLWAEDGKMACYGKPSSVSHAAAHSTITIVLRMARNRMGRVVAMS